MKKRIPNIVFIIAIIFGIIILLVGLSIYLYPTMSDYSNQRRQAMAITEYINTVEKLNNDKYKSMLQEAHKYNQDLYNKYDRFYMSDEDLERYDKLLDVSGDGIMAYVEIPAINCSLPIYHGTKDDVLQVAIGHIDATSLPVGGKNTHCVISGHRGLSSAKLFSDLDKLVEGDIFTINVLNDTLTYEIDQILVVLPNEVNDLAIVDNEDYFTLVTCTPYGVNTHRLLVRGHRIENINENSPLPTADAAQVAPYIIAPVVALPFLIIWGIALILKSKKKGKA